MNIQSLSIYVPGGCPNHCKYCVSKLTKNDYPNLIENEQEFLDLHEMDYENALAFARDNGCNTAILTGDGEPLINKKFINLFSEINNHLQSPFRWIELQTMGYDLAQLNDKGGSSTLRWLRNKIRVKTIALSLSDLFSNDVNAEINQSSKNMIINIDETCKQIKRYGFNLRISLNMLKNTQKYSINKVFKRLQKLQADQVIFRKMYFNDNERNLPNHFVEVNNFVKENACDQDYMDWLNDFILTNGRELETLPFGSKRYSVDNISTVIDNDCMAVESKQNIKYLILRPDCHLYTKWDDKGSKLF